MSKSQLTLDMEQAYRGYKGSDLSALYAQMSSPNQVAGQLHDHANAGRATESLVDRPERSNNPCCCITTENGGICSPCCCTSNDGCGGYCCCCPSSDGCKFENGNYFYSDSCIIPWPSSDCCCCQCLENGFSEVVSCSSNMFNGLLSCTQHCLSSCVGSACDTIHTLVNSAGGCLTSAGNDCGSCCACLGDNLQNCGDSCCSCNCECPKVECNADCCRACLGFGAMGGSAAGTQAGSGANTASPTAAPTNGTVFYAYGVDHENQGQNEEDPVTPIQKWLYNCLSQLTHQKYHTRANTNQQYAEQALSAATILVFAPTACNNLGSVACCIGSRLCNERSSLLKKQDNNECLRAAAQIFVCAGGLYLPTWGGPVMSVGAWGISVAAGRILQQKTAKNDKKYIFAELYKQNKSFREKIRRNDYSESQDLNKYINIYCFMKVMFNLAAGDLGYTLFMHHGAVNVKHALKNLKSKLESMVGCSPTEGDVRELEQLHNNLNGAVAASDPILQWVIACERNHKFIANTDRGHAGDDPANSMENGEASYAPMGEASYAPMAGVVDDDDLLAGVSNPYAAFNPGGLATIRRESALDAGRGGAPKAKGMKGREG